MYLVATLDEHPLQVGVAGFVSKLVVYQYLSSVAKLWLSRIGLLHDAVTGCKYGCSVVGGEVYALVHYSGAVDRVAVAHSK